MFVGSWPFLTTAFFYFGLGQAAWEKDGAIWLLLFPFLGFGWISFPVAAFAFYRSFLLLRGRTEIVLDAKNLRVVRKAGPLRSTRRCKLSQLGGFRREDPAGERYGLTGGRSTLVAVMKNGRTFRLLRMVPDGMNEQLIGELSARIERLTGRADLTGTDRILAEDLDAEVVSEDPMAIGPRKGKPIGSNLAVEQRDKELTIQVPPFGFRGSGSSAVRVGFMAVFAIQFVLTVTLVPALIFGKVQGGPPAAGWVVYAVFTAISIGLAMLLVDMSTRKGSIRVAYGELSLSEHNLFRNHHAVWSLNSIEEVRVGVEEHKDSDGDVSWTHFVEVKPGHGKSRHWFDHREKEELEWIVTCIVDHLERIANKDGS
jgi:hypothetical protein